MVRLCSAFLPVHVTVNLFVQHDPTAKMAYCICWRSGSTWTWNDSLVKSAANKKQTCIDILLR